ncbi:hypothetical protein LBMAG56_35390 [Verrucomicrobiota bacterium]|nr:hypothetical protein LBMAG56_35390 [Verrucomicrobiota bacterium]
MNPDPLIDEIREVRRIISAEFGHDPRRLVAHYMERQRKLRESGEHKFYDSRQPESESDLVLHDKPSKPR